MLRNKAGNKRSSMKLNFPLMPPSKICFPFFILILILNITMLNIIFSSGYSQHDDRSGDSNVFVLSFLDRFS